jgi:hypothetical protein
MSSTALSGTQLRTRSPQLLRLAGAAVVAIIAATIVNYVITLIGVGLLSVPAAFPAYQATSYIALTVIGVVGASVAWTIIAAKAKDPVGLLRKLALIIVPVSMLMDVALLVAGMSVIGVLTLLIMHVTVGAIAYYSLTRIAPPRPAV